VGDAYSGMILMEFRKYISWYGRIKKMQMKEKV
jgi:hypothetical protein